MNGKMLTAKILIPHNAIFTTHPVVLDRDNGQTPLNGVNRLELFTPESGTAGVFVVIFEPFDTTNYSDITTLPLGEWTATGSSITTTTNE